MRPRPGAGEKLLRAPVVKRRRQVLRYIVGLSPRRLKRANVPHNNIRVRLASGRRQRGLEGLELNPCSGEDKPHLDRQEYGCPGKPYFSQNKAVGCDVFRHKLAQASKLLGNCNLYFIKYTE